MSENEDIKLREGESKKIKLDIDIPLAVPGKDKPEVKPQQSGISNQQSGASQEQNEDEQSGDSGVDAEAGDSNVGTEPKTGDGSEVGDISKNENKAGGDQGESRDQKIKDNQVSDQKSNLSPVGEMNKRPERRKDKQEAKDNQGLDQKPKSSWKDKLEEGSGKLGDKILPKSRIPERNKNRSDVLDSDYEPGATKKQDLTSSWNRLRGSIRNKKNKEDAKESRSATGNIVNKGSRLASFEFYRLCWLNLIDSFGLTYFGLLFLFIAKYVAHSPKIVKFVTIKDDSVRLEIINNKEKTSVLMIVMFLIITGLLLLIIAIAVLLIVLYLKAMSLTLWGLITDSKQFFEDWKIIWEFIKAAL
jgi:hypothetical protein